MNRSSKQRLRAIYEAHYEYVLRTARRLGSKADDVDDVVQETFLVIARKIDELDLEQPLRPYLFGVVRRCGQSLRRRRGDVRAAQPEAASTQPAPERAEAVYALLRKLPEELRASLILIDVEGHTLPEAAEILQVPETTARSWLRRARSTAREALSLERKFDVAE